MVRDDEAEVIQAVLSGEIDRYAELVDTYHPFALRVAFSFLGNYEEAREVSQEAFVSAYRCLGRFRRGAAFSTWLFRIVVNACRDAQRRQARRPAMVSVGPSDDNEEAADLFVDVPDPSNGPSDQLLNRELSQHLSAAIGRLPLKQRTAFLLHHVHGLPLGEAAVVMGCRIGTVKSHLFRALASLKTQLSPWLAQQEEH